METGFAINTLKLRIIVSQLGEAYHYSWWATTFYAQSSAAFLEPIFPRTSESARYHGVLEAACRVHDEHLSLGCFHLFRLPQEQEQDLHEILCDGLNQCIEFGFGKDREALLALLDQMANNLSMKATGPISVGTIADIKKPEILSSMAAAYLGGFRQQSPVYPYLAASS